ncbi:MAG: AAA family ATPase, partial [Acidimicrobiales bacterium]
MLVGRPGLSPVMVGRGSQLARLRFLAGASGDPRVALVSGEAGSGKTRLIQELLAGIERPTKVLTAHAEEGAMGRPFNLLIEAVAADVSKWDEIPPELSAWEDSLATLLGAAAPVLRAQERTYGSDELLRSATELVRYLAAGNPVVMIFEDLHWADADSLGLFQRLSVTAGMDVLLVGTFRPEDLDRRHLTDLLSAVERHKQVEHVNIGRLGVNQVRSLIGAIRDTEVNYATAAALHSRTGGNPFFLEELLVSAGDIPVHDLAEYPLPRTLTEAVLRHLDGLDAEERRAVDAAAILGERIPFDLLTSVTGLGEDRLLDALRTLVDRGLLVEATEDVFSFRHALTREAVAGRLLGRERRRLHEKALAALEESGSDDWAALAHHAHAAGRLDEMIAAARKGASSYLRSGATYQALRLAELALHEGEADAELLELATLASWSVGLLATAVERAEQWRADAVERHDDHSLARALRFLARLRWETQNPVAHRKAVDEALEVADRLPAGEHRAWVANLAAEAAMLEGDAASAIRWADEAMEAAGQSPPARLLASILVNKGTALLDSAGHEEEGAALVQEGLRYAIESEDHQTTLRAINNTAHFAMPKWDPDLSKELLDQMREIIGRTGRQDWRDNWIELQAIFLAHVMGDLAQARSVLGMDTPVRGRRWVAIVDGELSFEAGELDRAHALLSKAYDDPRPPPSMVWDRGYSLGILARVAARRGDRQLTAHLLREFADVIHGMDGRRSSSFSDGWYGALTAACRSGLTIEEIQELENLLAGPLGPLGHQGDPGW